MDTQTILELVGYLSSILVLISFLMSSVVKLRVINSIGSFIFTIYAILIHSYPTAFLNACLICVNIYYLIRLTKTDKHYSLVDGKADDAYLKYFLNYYKDDIAAYFPDMDVNAVQMDAAYLVCCDAAPVGVLLGKAQGEGALEVVLDYSTPQFRDCSVGAYLYEQLPGKGVKKLTYAQASDKHAAYLQKMGFVKENNAYVKTLG